MEVAAKLRLVPGQTLAGVDVPSDVATAHDGVPLGAAPDAANALLVFVLDRAALEAHASTIVDSAATDRLTWVLYPKACQLGTDLNRDSLAALLTEHGARPVRQVSLDAVWSALRFRGA